MGASIRTALQTEINCIKGSTDKRCSPWAASGQASSPSQSLTPPLLRGCCRQLCFSCESHGWSHGCVCSLRGSQHGSLLGSSLHDSRPCCQPSCHSTTKPHPSGDFEHITGGIAAITRHARLRQRSVITGGIAAITGKFAVCIL